MKRKSSWSDNEKFKKYRKLCDDANDPADPLPQSFVDHLNAKFDNLITLDSKRMEAYFTTYYPESNLFKSTKDLKPSLVSESFWSGYSQRYVEYLRITWSTPDPKIAHALFGDALRERFYPDSQGVVDFENSQGGKLVPEVSKRHPLKLVYNCLTKELTVHFFFDKLKAFNENNSILFKEV